MDVEASTAGKRFTNGIDAPHFAGALPLLAGVRLAFELDDVRANVLALKGAAQQVLVDVDSLDAALGETFNHVLVFPSD